MIMHINDKQNLNVIEVADMEEGGFLVATPDGMGDAPGGSMGSFNCSRTDGPLGPPCDPDRTRQLSMF